MELAAGESKSWRATFLAVQRSTRVLYPGAHMVEICLNGQVHPLGEFELLPESMFHGIPPGSKQCLTCAASARRA